MYQQDKLFDSKVGVKSTALLFDRKTRLYLSCISGSMLSCLAFAGYMNNQGLLFYLISVAGAGSHLTWQLRTTSFDDVADCGKKFKSNKWVGLLIFGGIAADGIWQGVVAS